jgi:hypothetical protein
VSECIPHYTRPRLPTPGKAVLLSEHVGADSSTRGAIGLEVRRIRRGKSEPGDRKGLFFGSELLLERTPQPLHCTPKHCTVCTQPLVLLIRTPREDSELHTGGLLHGDL